MRPVKGNFTREVVEEVGKQIVRGDFAPGSSMPNESALAEQFGASRTVVREAVKMLTAKGLVGSRPRMGTFVEIQSHWNILDRDVLRWMLGRRFSADLLLEFQVVRKGIEPLACYEAAVRGDRDAIAKIALALEKMASAKTAEEHLLADIAFHKEVLVASGNRFITELGAVVETALRFAIKLTNRAKGVHHASLTDHRRIYEAISKGRAEDARKAMLLLLDEAIELTTKTISKQ